MFELILFVVLLLIFLPKIVGVLVGLINKILVKVPEAHLGVLLRWGKRVDVLDEGWHIILPFIEKIIIVPNKLVSVILKAEAASKDGEWMNIEGEMQYRLDPRIKRNNRSVCLESSSEVVQSGTSASIQEKIVAIANLFPADYLRKHINALADFIECWLKRDYRNQPQYGKSVDVKKILDFYDENYGEAKRLIEEAESSPDISAIEQRYGIDVEAFSLTKIDWTGKTKEMRESARQAALAEKALKRREEKIKSLIAAGVPPQSAVDEVDVAMDPRIVPQKVSVQGGGNSTLLFGMPNLFGSQTQKGEGDGKKKGGRQ